MSMEEAAAETGEMAEARRLAGEVSRLSPDARLEAIYLMRQKFCPHCGEDHTPPHLCQCWNDD